MPVNHLEQLVCEWYELDGYFLRRNVLVGKRPNGGYECELDVVAFHPAKKRVVQIEPSGDADSWATRESRFEKKFAAGRRHIPSLFPGLDLPDTIEQIALLTLASKRTRDTIGGGKIVLVSEFVREIREALRARRFVSNAIGENMPLLRMIQMMNEYE